MSLFNEPRSQKGSILQRVERWYEVASNLFSSLIFQASHFLDRFKSHLQRLLSRAQSYTFKEYSNNVSRSL